MLLYVKRDPRFMVSKRDELEIYVFLHFQIPEESVNI
jgi:hypothetical protein